MSQEDKFRPVIAITVGDLNGIGLEIIINTLSDVRILNYCIPVIYGNVSALNYHKKTMDNKQFVFHQITTIEQLHPKRINLINCWEDNIKINLGMQNPENGKYAFLSLKRAVEDAQLDRVHGILTAPIDKFSMQSDDFKFPGHTEYLSERFNCKTLMLMVSEQLRVGTVTGHIPISEVADSITTELIIDKLKLMHNTLYKDFSIKAPKIAVIGLNPHAGDSGLIGKEEEEIIIPAIESAKSKGALVFGPFPADGFFGTRMYQNFDGVLTMYHDQGLVPFKTISFENGVNYTAGLPIPRTSPDHGVAYNIAGKDMADESSFRSALYLLLDVIKERSFFKEINENPLQKQFIVDKEKRPE